MIKQHAPGGSPSMSNVTALLLSTDASLIESCRQVAESIPRLRLAVAAQPEPVGVLLPQPDVALFLAHIRHQSDTEWARCLLRQVGASGRPRPTVILGEQHLPNEALTLLHLGATDYQTRPLDMNRLSYVMEMLTVRA